MAEKNRWKKSREIESKFAQVNVCASVRERERGREREKLTNEVVFETNCFDDCCNLRFPLALT